MQNGIFHNYYETGKIHKTGTYVNFTGIDTLTIYSTDGNIISKSTWTPVSFKKSKIIWRKLYEKDARRCGTVEIIDGKNYIWTLGEKHEIIADTTVKVNILTPNKK